MSRPQCPLARCKDRGEPTPENPEAPAARRSRSRRSGPLGGDLREARFASRRLTRAAAFGYDCAGEAAREGEFMTHHRPSTAAARRRQPIASEGPFARAAARLRIALDDGRQLGPGKIDLLEALGRTGSIAAAAREMGMSERRALLLVEAVNRFFRQRVVAVGNAAATGDAAELHLLRPRSRRRLQARRGPHPRRDPRGDGALRGRPRRGRRRPGLTDRKRGRRALRMLSRGYNPLTRLPTISTM